jgi:hypothetical protein
MPGDFACVKFTSLMQERNEPFSQIKAISLNSAWGKSPLNLKMMKKSA